MISIYIILNIEQSLTIFLLWIFECGYLCIYEFFSQFFITIFTITNTYWAPNNDFIKTVCLSKLLPSRINMFEGNSPSMFMISERTLEKFTNLIMCFLSNDPITILLCFPFTKHGSKKSIVNATGFLVQQSNLWKLEQWRYILSILKI